MALISCPECSKEISDKADFCPHCGFTNQNTATATAPARSEEIVNREVFKAANHSFVLGEITSISRIETRGWVFGLDNVSLGMFADSVPILGDFDSDGELTANDIDLLSSQIPSSPQDPGFDLNADGIVDSADHQHWVTSSDIANTILGDADLDHGRSLVARSDRFRTATTSGPHHGESTENRRETMRGQKDP